MCRGANVWRTPKGYCQTWKRLRFQNQFKCLHFQLAIKKWESDSLYQFWILHKKPKKCKVFSRIYFAQFKGTNLKNKPQDWVRFWCIICHVHATQTFVNKRQERAISLGWEFGIYWNNPFSSCGGKCNSYFHHCFMSTCNTLRGLVHFGAFKPFNDTIICILFSTIVQWCEKNCRQMGCLEGHG